VSIAAAKKDARQAAFAARKAAATPQAQARLATELTAALAAHREKPLAGYLPIRTEADPRPAMSRHARQAPVGVPVVLGPGRPLAFRRWTPDSELIEGAFKVLVPKNGAVMTPEVVIVPMAAFDGRGYRLGYGGGFYDRTLARLRSKGSVMAIGVAFAAQQLDALPIEATDQPLDGVVTEQGLRWF